MKARLISLILTLVILNASGLLLMQQQSNQDAIIPTLAQLAQDAANSDLLASAGMQNAVSAVQPTALPVKTTTAPDAVSDTVVVQFAAETSPDEQIALIESAGGVVQAQDTENYMAVIQSADSIETIAGLETSPLVIAAAPQSPEAVSNTDEPIIITQAQIQPPPKPIDQLLATAREDGSVRVIVMLNVQTYAEASISARGVSAQRANIRFRQTQLVNRVAQFRTDVDVLYDVIPAIAMTVDAAALEYLAASPDVLTIEEDRLHTVDLASSIPVVGANAAWANGYSGAGQTIAILDTGVDLDHPFLSGRIVAEACFSTTNSEATTLCPNGLDSQTGTGSADAMTAACLNGGVSICDHGSHVAGIAAGNDDANGNDVSYYGVAPDANIIAIQVFHRNTNPLCSGGICTYDSDYLAALQYVYNLRTTYDIAAANLSLGGGQYFAACDSAAPAILSIANQLWAANIATVASSGNNGFTSSMGHPACVSTIVSVGNSTDSDGVASSSNVASFMDLFAPGSSITSSIPNNTYATFNGTSMSAPHVAGAFALMAEAAPDASVEDMLSALETTGLLVTDTRSGAPGNITIPRIRIDAAIDALVGSVANDDFDAARLISSLPYTHSVNTTNATVAVDDPLSTCDLNPGKTVWYQYTPSASVNVTFDTLGSGFNTVLSVWAGTRGNLIPVACNDDTSGMQSQVSLSLVNGITYTIMVAGYNGAEGSLVFNAKLQPPTNDLIANAITIPAVSYSNQQVTTTATNESLTGCSGTGIGSTIWYKYTAPITATVVFDTFGSNYDTVLGLYTGSVANPTYLTCNDDSGGLQSQVTYSLTANTTYYIRVGGYTGATGNLKFNASLQLTTFCNSVTDIPLSECQALHRLYISTNGANWTNRTGWLSSPYACSWYGITCSGYRVSSIWIVSNKLNGTIPSDLRLLTNLQRLRLGSNTLTGSIPPELGSLRYLNLIWLISSQLTGSIPPELGYLNYLDELRLEFNQLTGSIPPELGYLRSLRSMQLTRNNLTGSIPVKLANLANLEHLLLGDNQLTGNIPPELADMPTLTTLYLYGNQLSGGIPPEFGNFANLEFLLLYDNQLSGSIPPELGNVTTLWYLWLHGNQLSGSVPIELTNLPVIRTLNLSDNQLSGVIPPELGSMTSLRALHLSKNLLEGNIPLELANLLELMDLGLGENNLTGSIPIELTNLAHLTTLDLSGNQLSGSIPPAFGNLTNLGYLMLNDNQLSGSIPSELGNLGYLSDLWLQNNQFTGSIPSSFDNLSYIQFLSLGNNQLTGSIDVLGNLSGLWYLALNDNQFTGSIDALGNLSNLWYLYLDNNQFSGEIPESIGISFMLSVFSANNNYLTGEVPSVLASQWVLDTLEISTNCLVSSNPDVITFLNSKDADWAATQDHCYYEPYGLAYDGDGDLFIANEGGQGSFVAILGADDVVRTAANGFLGAADVAFNSAGVLHVADDSNAIYQVDGSGTVTTFIAVQTGIDNPNALAFDSSDNLYILNAVGNLAKFDSAGNPISVNFATGFSTPQGLAVFGNTVYVSDAVGTIYAVDGTTGAIATYATTSYATQGGLTVDTLGNLFMAAYDAGSVISVTAFDQSIFTCISGLSQPRGLALNGTSQIAVSSHSTHQVTKHALCDLPPTENVAEVTLQVVELDAEPGILLHEVFDIEVSISDIRATTSGQAVLEGYLDVWFDEAFVQVNAITYDADYPTSQTGTVNTGLVDEVGAIGGSSPAADGRVFTLHLTAVGVGTTSISTQSASNPASRITLYDYSWNVRDWTIHDSISIDIIELRPDLVTTSLDAQPDHVLAGQTSITFTITNQGNRPAPATTASVVLSDDATVGNADDVLVTTIDVPVLGVNAQYTDTVVLSLPVATLYTHAANNDATGQAIGTVSSNIDTLALVLDPGNTLNEWEEGNNTATDDITYFGWDNNADTVVSPLDAIFAINRLGGAVPHANIADTDGNIQVNAADVNAIVDRFGYARNTTVDEIPATPPVITASSGNVQLRLVPNNSSADSIYMMALGDTFDVNLYVEDMRGITPQSVYTAYTNLHFNPAVVQVTGMTYGADFTKLQLGMIDNVTGTISNLGAAASSFTPSSNTLLVTVHFAVSGYGNMSITTGAADHALAHTTIYGDDNAQHITQSGEVVLWVRPMPTATATPTDTPVPTNTPTPMIQTVGLFSNGTWTFRDSNTNGTADVRFQFGSTEAGWLPLVGDWDGDDVDGIGVYRNGTFILRDTSSAGTIEYVVTLGIAESGWQPVAGDWDGDGRDTVGLYKNGLWLLTNVLQRNAPVAHRVSFNPFGAVSSAVLAGDWNSDGRDSVGLYFNGSFSLLNHLAGTPSVTSFSFGPRESGWLPLAGDWDGDGRDTIGIYKDSLWRLRNTNSAGAVDIGFTFRGLGVPVANYRGGIVTLAALAVAPAPTETPLAALTVAPTWIPTLTPIVPETTIVVEPSAEVTLEVQPTLEPAVDMSSTATPVPTEIPPQVTAIETATLPPAETTQESASE